MDTNSIYEGYGFREKKNKQINRSFYTEKVKETSKQETIFQKIKNRLMRKLL